MVTIDMYFDTRRLRKKTKDYPYKLCVYDGDRSYFPTIYGLSKADNDKLSAPRLGPSLQDLKDKFKEILRLAVEAAGKIDPFDIEEFEQDFILGNPHFDQARIKPRKIPVAAKDFDYTPYYKKFPTLLETFESGTIGEVYLIIIKKKILRGKIGTAISYQDSFKSFVRYGGNLKFQKLTEDYLFQYLDWMKNNTDGKKKKCTKTTCGIYLRSLRRVFNLAASLKIINKEKCYPFGIDKVGIPGTRNVKKHLELTDVEKLYYYDCNPEMPWLRKAIAYWFWIYFGNGMNVKDMCGLQWKNITGEFLEFERIKTEETSREDPPKISVFLNREMWQIIDEFGNKDRSPENYIFPIYEIGMDPLRMFEESRLTVAFINNWIKVILAELGIKKKGTTYVIRHTFSTIQRRAGASIDDITEYLGSRSAKRYVGSLESELKRSVSDNLSTFKKPGKTTGTLLEGPN